MSERKSFILYLDNAPQVNMLSNEQAGILFKAIYAYVAQGTEPELQDSLVKMAFSFIAASLSRDAKKYESICKRNAENGRKGGRPRKNTESQKTQKTEGFFKKPKKADSDSDSDSDNDSDNDSDSVCDSVNDNDTEQASPARSTQAHTPHNQDFLFSEIAEISGNLGYHWSEQEIKAFVSYNLDAGRHLRETPNWEWAVQKWEEQRPKHPKPQTSDSGMNDDLLQQYLEVGQSWIENVD